MVTTNERCRSDRIQLMNNEAKANKISADSWQLSEEFDSRHATVITDYKKNGKNTCIIVAA